MNSPKTIKCLRYRERLIIVWKMSDGKIQPFYKSTERNSGSPGTWFPFDGYTTINGHGWLIKQNGIMRRYGTVESKNVADRIFTDEWSEMLFFDIEDTDCGERINEFLEEMGWENPKKPPTRKES